MIVVFSLLPVAIGLVWGTYLDDSAYVAFRCARDLAHNRAQATSFRANLNPNLGLSLYTLALVLPARFGAPLPQIGLILSALGWGITALALYNAGLLLHRPVAGSLAAALVAFSPIIVSTLGTEISWTVALAWIAILLSMKKQWNAQTGALVLMLWVHFDLSTLALAALLWLIQWIEREDFPWQMGLVLATAALLGFRISDLGFQISGFGSRISGLLDESEFYWLFLPLMGLGIYSLFITLRTQSSILRLRFHIHRTRSPKASCGLAGTAGAAGQASNLHAKRPISTRSVQPPILLWPAVSILTGSTTAEAVTVITGLFLAGLGMDWAIEWIETHNLFRFKAVQFELLNLKFEIHLVVSLALIASLPLGIAQISSLLQRYQFRPVVQQELEDQAARWLRFHTEPTEAILSSERVGYLADRPTLAWDGAKSGEGELALLMKTLNENPPEYCVSFRSAAWDRLKWTGWFQDGYTSLQTFRSPYDSTSPFTIWSYRFSALDSKERQLLNVHLPRKVDLIGYKHWPNRIQAGEAVEVALFLQATQPVTEAFRSVLRVISPDGVGWAQRDTIAPRSIPLHWWQTGQAVTERFVLTTTTDIPAGVYQLDMAVVTPDSANLLPIYENGNDSPLERIVLGYVVVPWQDEAQQAAVRQAAERAKPVGANLGNQISLLSFEAADSPSAGAEFEVKLYWEAQRSPEDDYIVFVHLLDAEGQLVDGHDGPPMDRRYPTGAWLPGEVVLDAHRLEIPPETPAGTYRLQAGMYSWPSLERLPAWDSQGVEQVDRVIVLQTIEVR